MSITVVVVAHAEPVEPILANLDHQTVRADETLVYVSDTTTQHPHVVVSNLNDWGHDKRARGLAAATSEFVFFANADDEYEPEFIERLAGEHDIVACDFTSRGRIVRTQPKVGQITSGSFIVRTELARQVGYNHRHYEADGVFIEELMAAGARFHRVPEILYHHR